MKLVKRRRKKIKKDVKEGGFRRWSGWRGAYSPVDHLHGPVTVRKIDPVPPPPA